MGFNVGLIGFGVGSMGLLINLPIIGREIGITRNRGFADAKFIYAKLKRAISYTKIKYWQNKNN